MNGRNWKKIMRDSGGRSLGSLLVEMAQDAADEHMRQLTRSLNSMHGAVGGTDRRHAVSDDTLLDGEVTS
ncbi:MAG: hypothetical protein GC162_02960 [Planctomycetes bacterium]|nr:hypothetical protein [Planctomycetota bacterium]